MDKDSAFIRRSAAYYAGVTDRRTAGKLNEQLVYPIPKAGDHIVYNETPRHQDKFEGRPNRGVGTVTSVLGCNIYISKMGKNGNFFTTSIMIKDLRCGLYQFVRLSKLPDRFVDGDKLDIKKLPNDIKELVVSWPKERKRLVGPV